MCVYNPFSLNLLYSGHCFSKFLPPSQGSQILVFISAFPPELQNHIITWSWKSLLSCSSDTLSSCSSVYPKQSLIFFFSFSPVSTWSQPHVFSPPFEKVRTVDISLHILSSFSPYLLHYSSRLIRVSFSIPRADYLIQHPPQPPLILVPWF